MRMAYPFIDGEWIQSNRSTIPVINPYTDEKIGEQLISTEQDVELALSAAYVAKKEIERIPVYEKARILKKASRLLESRKTEFATLISEELGKPLKNTLDEVSRSVETLELSAEEAKRLIGETIPGSASQRGTSTMAMTFRVPVGVIAAITPFNAPLNLICHKIAPAFAAGNSVILKPAPQTPLIATEFLKLLLEAGFPKKAIQMVLGGADIGQQIVKDHRVNVISFTGGVSAALNISALSGMKKVLLELGGNAATIVHQDADIQRAADLCVRTGYSNSGQSCISVQRIYVHQEVLEPFTKMLKEKVENLIVGDPLVENSDIGTMVNKQAADRVMSWIEEALESGATLVTGGKQNGATITPTVLLNPPSRAKVVCEEVFGPVVSIIPYTSIDEAIKETNNSPFGLQAGLFTNSMDLIYKVSRELEVGGVVINGTSNFRLDHLPYGGIKNSGVGREGPHYAIQEMTEMKMIVFQYPN